MAFLSVMVITFLLTMCMLLANPWLTMRLRLPFFYLRTHTCARSLGFSPSIILI